MKTALRIRWIAETLVVAGALVTCAAPALAQDYGAAGTYNYAAAGQQLDSLVSQIALYPDPLLAQIFAASAFPDQVAAAAQGSSGPFDPSVEALMQYPSVLQMMASNLGWTQALGEAVMQDQGAVMDAIQNLRREAQQYGYLQSGPQMQVMDSGGYIDIEPVGGYMYPPIYDPYVVFAPPRPGFFPGGAIRFGGGFHWAGGYNSFNWRNHQVLVNRRVWTPPAPRMYREPQRQFEPRRFEDNGGSFAGGNRNRAYSAPAMQPHAQRNFAAPQGRNFTPAAPRSMERHSFAAPRQMEQRGFTPQQRNQGERFQRGGEGRARGR